MKEKLINGYSWIQALLKSEKGQGMVEYALVLVFIVAIAAYFIGSGGLGDGVQKAVNDTKDVLNGTTKAPAQSGGNTASGT